MVTNRSVQVPESIQARNSFFHLLATPVSHCCSAAWSTATSIGSSVPALAWCVCKSLHRRTTLAPSVMSAMEDSHARAHTWTFARPGLSSSCSLFRWVPSALRATSTRKFHSRSVSAGLSARETLSTWRERWRGQREGERETRANITRKL